MLSVIFTLLLVTLCGLCAAEGTVGTLQVKAGDTARLHSNVKPGDYLVEWKVNRETLVYLDNGTSLLNPPESYKGRLHVDRTGSLNITDLRPEDSGVYKGTIINKNNMMHPVIYKLTVLTAVNTAPSDTIELTAKTGENFTVWTGLNNDTQAILSSDSVVLVNFNEGEIPHIKENILMDMKTGSIIMLNVQREDSKVYKLQIYNGNVPGTTHYINLTVTERLPQVSGDYTTVPPTQRPSPLRVYQRSHLAAYISVGLAAAVAVLILTACLKKKRTQRKLNQLKDCASNSDII